MPAKPAAHCWQTPVELHLQQLLSALTAAHGELSPWEMIPYMPSASRMPQSNLLKQKSFKGVYTFTHLTLR
jgi:hypothetical protein